MKTIRIDLVIVIIIAVFSMMWLSLDHEEKNQQFEYEQELRLQQEYLKACEARMMYLDNVVKQNGIEVIQ